MKGKWKTGWWVIRGITLWKWVEKWFTRVGMEEASVEARTHLTAMTGSLGVKAVLMERNCRWEIRNICRINYTFPKMKQIVAPTPTILSSTNANKPKRTLSGLWSLTIYLRNCKTWQWRKHAVWAVCLHVCFPSSVCHPRHTLNTSQWVHRSTIKHPPDICMGKK